ncbi:hypothetical protein [Streptomyces sp. SID1121]|uniref:hypothetical protein n=1 Tax=Streptomyces sp. SID1121 TaxID=3425888 RepID=UPI0040577B55
MTSTPRFDRLAADGTGPAHDRIRLADGQGILVRTRPGIDAVDEVFVSPGVSVPDTEAWGNEDHLEGWLTGGNAGESSSYADVPVEAVRTLIVQHGGEHADQGNEWTLPDPTEEQGDVLAEIADLYGRFEDGYSADGIRTVFARIYDEVGVDLVCVWDYADEYGYGGNSEFFAEDEDGALFEVQPDIHLWLSGKRETPGPVDTWVCAPVTEPTDVPVSDDFHNYARTDRTK